MTLTLINSLSKEEYSFTVKDLDDTGMYWHFKMTLPEGLPEGEYDYTLLDKNGNKVANGIAVIGDYHRPVENNYQSEKPVFKQYGKN